MFNGHLQKSDTVQVNPPPICSGLAFDLEQVLTPTLLVTWTYASRLLTVDLPTSYFIYIPLLYWALNDLSYRPCISPQSILQSVKGQRPPSSLQVSPDTCSILDNILQRMRLRLEQRHSSLTDRIQAITHRSDGTLSETDVWKVSGEQSGRTELSQSACGFVQSRYILY